MSNCMELAAQLGRAIAQSPQAAALRAARDAMEADAELSRTLTEYQQQMMKVAQLEDEQKPVEAEDKHRLQDLNNKLVSSALFKKFTSAQVEYVDIMRKVNEALRRELAETEEPEE